MWLVYVFWSLSFSKLWLDIFIFSDVRTPLNKGGKWVAWLFYSYEVCWLCRGPGNLDPSSQSICDGFFRHNQHSGTRKPILWGCHSYRRLFPRNKLCISGKVTICRLFWPYLWIQQYPTYWYEYLYILMPVVLWLLVVFASEELGWDAEDITYCF